MSEQRSEFWLAVRRAIAEDGDFVCHTSDDLNMAYGLSNAGLDRLATIAEANLPDLAAENARLKTLNTELVEKASRYITAVARTRNADDNFARVSPEIGDKEWLELSAEIEDAHASAIICENELHRALARATEQKQ